MGKGPQGGRRADTLMAMLATMLSAALFAAAEPAPLLPDGATLTNVEGVLIRPQAGDPWHLRLAGDAAPTDGRVRDLVLMPSRVLEDMERSQADGDGTFLVTGDVTLFDGRNWLMPRHAEARTAHTHRDVPTTEPASPDAPEDDSPQDGTPEDAMRAGTSDGDSIEDIVADLQSTIRTLPRTLDTGTDFAGEQSDELDGTLMHARRGRLLRGRHGAWVLVFDADAWGQGDEPAVLLPSPMLEQLIRQGRRADYREPIHLSGSITRYRGRRFLIPTAVTPLYERPNLGR